MSKYAVIDINGSQYKVVEGDTILVPGSQYEEGKKVVCEDVLLLVEDGKAQIGSPTLAGVSVEAKSLGNKKGEKVRVLKYKAKSRYRRQYGVRPQYSQLQIEKIKKAK